VWFWHAFEPISELKTLSARKAAHPQMYRSIPDLRFDPDDKSGTAAGLFLYITQVRDSLLAVDEQTNHQDQDTAVSDRFSTLVEEYKLPD
jgi:hypothetical protein